MASQAPNRYQICKFNKDEGTMSSPIKEIYCGENNLLTNAKFSIGEDDVLKFIYSTYNDRDNIREVKVEELNKNADVALPSDLIRSHSSQIVEFNDELILIGGYSVSESKYIDKIWSSSDGGLTWTIKNPSPLFGEIEHHRCVVFQNKIWLLGGNFTNKTSNEYIWSTEDLMTWTQSEFPAPFGERINFGCCVYDNNLVVVGGETYDKKDVINLNDAWSSWDGVFWEQKTESVGSRLIGINTAVIHNNELICCKNKWEYFYSTTDLINWTASPTDNFAFDTPIIFKMNDNFYSLDMDGDFHISIDLINWEIISNYSPFIFDVSFNWTIYEDKMIIVGIGNDTSLFSYDMIHWNGKILGENPILDNEEYFYMNLSFCELNDDKFIVYDYFPEGDESLSIKVKKLNENVWEETDMSFLDTSGILASGFPFLTDLNDKLCLNFVGQTEFDFGVVSYEFRNDEWRKNGLNSLPLVAHGEYSDFHIELTQFGNEPVLSYTSGSNNELKILSFSQQRKRPAILTFNKFDSEYIMASIPVRRIDEKGIFDPHIRTIIDWGDNTTTSFFSELSKKVWLQKEYDSSVEEIEIKIFGEHPVLRFGGAPEMTHYLKSMENLENINFGKDVTYFANMFYFCPNLETVDIPDTSSGIEFAYMFSYCTSLESVSLSDTSSGTIFYGMFHGCESLVNGPELDTSNGRRFQNMFSYCTNLESVPDLDTSNGMNFGYMFHGCGNLTSISLSSVSSGESNQKYDGMFYDCISLESIHMPGINGDISFRDSNLLDKTEREKIYTEYLEPVDTPMQITMPYPSLTEDDSIAEAKNWTVNRKPPI